MLALPRCAALDDAGERRLPAMALARCACLGLLMTVRASVAAATLVDAGFTTIDTESGLEWLDLDPAAGLSWQDVEDGFGGFAAAGWRHATLDEVCTLLEHGGVAPPTCPGGFGDSFPPADTLATFIAFQSLFGFVHVGNVGFPFLTTQGVFTDSDGSWDGVGLAAVRFVFGTDGASSRVSSSVQENHAGSGSSTAGDLPTMHWLVREVPEPGTALLLALGLLCFVDRRTMR